MKLVERVCAPVIRFVVMVHAREIYRELRFIAVKTEAIIPVVVIMTIVIILQLMLIVVLQYPPMKDKDVPRSGRIAAMKPYTTSTTARYTAAGSCRSRCFLLMSF